MCTAMDSFSSTGSSRLAPPGRRFRMASTPLPSFALVPAPPPVARRQPDGDDASLAICGTAEARGLSLADLQQAGAAPAAVALSAEAPSNSPVWEPKDLPQEGTGEGAALSEPPRECGEVKMTPMAPTAPPGRSRLPRFRQAIAAQEAAGGSSPAAAVTQDEPVRTSGSIGIGGAPSGVRAPRGGGYAVKENLFDEMVAFAVPRTVGYGPQHLHQARPKVQRLPKDAERLVSMIESAAHDLVIEDMLPDDEAEAMQLMSKIGGSLDYHMGVVSKGQGASLGYR
eukprot:TRINITY_DN49143_c0_g1_i1.p1 TRINITY_DN49143_c0_g1~~TRINITY_DN49143_c0_g1_i1.p1  ORF type:complete len:283 (-),score=55.08 TRINITY_DN49143_c0_g1_i1:200-1048(-)